MRTIISVGIATAVLALLGVTAAGILAGGGSTDTSTVFTGETTTERTETSTARQPGEDMSGPCDEAEHANDPRCAGAGAGQEPRGRGAAVTAPREPGEDVSGPCDEAEHANDPRCTGAGAEEDRSGRGRGRGGDDDDRSGSNRGPG